MKDVEIIRNAYIETLGRCDDTKLICTADWVQTVTASDHARWFNRVIFSTVPNGQEARRLIEETVKTYQANGADCEWLVWPDTVPSEFAALLAAVGFTREEVAFGMLLETALYSQLETPTRLVAEPLERKDIAQFVDVSARGWTERDIDTDFAVSRMEGVFDANDFFWVKIDGEPIATAETQYVSDSGYLCGSSVLPDYRGLGAYRLLIKRRLEQLAENGVPLASSIALEGTSAPILEKLGFRNVASIRYFAKTNR